MSRLIDLTGKTFGRLTVVERSSSDKRGHTRWLCKCECGGSAIVRGSHLRRGETISCGCYAREASARAHGESHGHSDDRLYSVWQTMKRRCDNPNSEKYHAYGGRGISVCREWRDSFTAFRNWSLENGYDYDAPYGKCTIDRIDVDGNYEPSNCRWVDAKTQANNRRPTPKHTKGITVSYKGVEYVSLSELADAYGFDENKLYRRIHRMTIDEAMKQIIGR